MPSAPQINRNSCQHHGFCFRKGAGEYPNVILFHLPIPYRKSATEQCSLLVSGPHLDIILLGILP